MRPILVGFVAVLTLAVGLALGRFVLPETEPPVVPAECSCAIALLTEAYGRTEGGEGQFQVGLIYGELCNRIRGGDDPARVRREFGIQGGQRAQKAIDECASGNLEQMPG